MDVQIKDLYYQLLDQEEIELETYPDFWKVKFEGKEKCAGVYILRNNQDEIVYVGETRTIKHRVKDLLNTHNHTLRRAIYKILKNEDKLYEIEECSDYKTSKKSISTYICKNFTYSYLEVKFGRKELEEYIFEKEKSSIFLLNYIRVNQRLQI